MLEIQDDTRTARALSAALAALDAILAADALKAAVEDGPPAVTDPSNPHGLPVGDDIAQLLRRTFRDMSAHTRGWLAAHGTDRRPAEPPDLSRYVRPLARRLEPLIARYGTDAAARTVAALWDGESIEVDHGTSARERARFAAESIVHTTMDQLRTALTHPPAGSDDASGSESKMSLPAPLRQLWTALQSVFRRAITDRAPAIGRVEASEATHAGAVRAARSVQARFGQKIGKRWIVDGNPCHICIDNNAAGVIPVDDEFPSGHMHPTAHNHCQCSLEFVPMDSAGS
jgi:hypothetical protein